MGYFQVRYDSRVVIYDRKIFIRLATGLVVMGGDSCSKGCEFESWHCLLDAHFSHLFVVKIVMCVWKDKRKRIGGRGWPIKKTLQGPQSRFEPCLRSGYFLLLLSECMMATCILLASVRVHEHWWPIEPLWVTPVKAIRVEVEFYIKTVSVPIRLMLIAWTELLFVKKGITCSVIRFGETLLKIISLLGILYLIWGIGMLVGKFSNCKWPNFEQSHLVWLIILQNLFSNLFKYENEIVAFKIS